jgi:hypothetical protein
VNFYLIKEAKVALVPFSAFRYRGWHRELVPGIGRRQLAGRTSRPMIPRIKDALLKLEVIPLPTLPEGEDFKILDSIKCNKDELTQRNWKIHFQTRSLSAIYKG